MLNSRSLLGQGAKKCPLLQNQFQPILFGTRSGLREKTRVTSSVENKWEWNSLINEACFQILMHNACCLCHIGFKEWKSAKNRFTSHNLFSGFSRIFKSTVNIFGSSRLTRFILKICQTVAGVGKISQFHSSNFISGGFFATWSNCGRGGGGRWRHISAPFKRKNNCHPSYFGRIAHLRLWSVEIGKRNLKIFIEGFLNSVPYLFSLSPCSGTVSWKGHKLLDLTWASNFCNLFSIQCPCSQDLGKKVNHTWKSCSHRNNYSNKLLILDWLLIFVC